MPIPLHDYNLDGNNLEIFPHKIWRDPNIVFHGTSEYHSPQLERNGFVQATSPYNIDDAQELLRILKLLDIAPFDTPKTFGITVAQSLSSYIFGIEKKTLD